MGHLDKQKRHFLALGGLSALGSITASLSGCSTSANVAQVTRERPAPSLAKTPKEYRADAARHLYSFNGLQIFKGKLPPLLHAITVVRLDISADGDLVGIEWMRKPAHAPEVVAQIEEKIRAAEPFPKPVHLGALTYTETWLWHKSGLFQLDTLTEGQT
jgi:periplasmic protein TonB